MIILSTLLIKVLLPLKSSAGVSGSQVLCKLCGPTMPLWRGSNSLCPPTVVLLLFCVNSRCWLHSQELTYILLLLDCTNYCTIFYAQKASFLLYCLANILFKIMLISLLTKTKSCLTCSELVLNLPNGMTL